MNLSSIEFGAQVIDCSSEVFTCEARNILSDDLSSIWLSDGAPPQWICISLVGSSTRQHRSNLFGGVDDTGMTLCLFLSSKVKVMNLHYILSIAYSQLYEYFNTDFDRIGRPGEDEDNSSTSVSSSVPAIRSIGWQCWHSYSTNPRTVKIHVSSDGNATQRKAQRYTNIHAIHI